MKRSLWIAFYTLYVGVLLYKLWGLVSVNEVLPSGDGIGHFLALRDFTENLSDGRWNTYLGSWFGGMPFLQFYAPLPFVIIAGFHALLGKLVSLFLLFRFFIFGTLLVFPLGFYWFVREYVGPRAAQFSIWLSFAWVFYPKLMSASGIGASGAIFCGLFSQVFAMSLLLVFLVAFRKILVRENVSRWWYLVATVSFASIILSHTITAIQAVFLVVVIGAYYWRALLSSTKKLLSVSGALVLGGVLSSFWLVPFLGNLAYTSGERIVASVYKNPILLFFPFDPVQIFSGEFANFGYGWLFIGALAFVGLVALIRERKFILPYLLGVSFLVLSTDYIPQFYFGPIHYYRFFPFEFVMFLAIAGYGLSYLWDKLAERRVVRWFAFGIFSLSIVGLVGSFNLGGGSVPSNNTLRVSGFPNDIPYYWSLEDFGEMRNGQRVINFLNPGNTDLPEPPVRILPDFNPQFSTEKLSSIHYFDTALPFANGESVLFGLYAESAWQLPFIFPTSDAFLGNNLQWGKVTPLGANGYFQSQGPEQMADRLRLFGVNYIITSSEYAPSRVMKIAGVKKIFSSGPFNVFWLGKAKPNVYAPAFKPGLYVNADGSLPFRDLALGWYSVPELLEHPIASLPNLPSGVPTITDTEGFGYVVLGTSKISEEQIAFVSALKKPVIILDRESGEIPSGLTSSTPVVVNFNPIAERRVGATVVQPNVASLELFRDFVLKNSIKNEPSLPVTVRSWGSDLTSFIASGPIIVNMSYFPYWHRTDGGVVYPVTPGQMLVFASGTLAISYSGDSTANSWGWVSFASVVLILGGAGVLAWKKKRVDAA